MALVPFPAYKFTQPPYCYCWWW